MKGAEGQKGDNAERSEGERNGEGSFPSTTTTTHNDIVAKANDSTESDGTLWRCFLAHAQGCISARICHKS